MIRRMANIDRVAHQPHAGDARRPLEPDSHPRCHVRQSPPLPGTYEPFRRRDHLQHPSRPMDAPGGRRLTVEARDHPTHKQKVIYSLSEPALQLVPLLAVMGAGEPGGRRHTPVSHELSIRAQLLERGGEPMREAFMADLRSTHLGAPTPGRSVSAELQAAFDRAVRRRSASRN